jgi:hypothetical protein
VAQPVFERLPFDRRELGLICGQSRIHVHLRFYPLLRGQMRKKRG